MRIFFEKTFDMRIMCENYMYTVGIGSDRSEFAAITARGGKELEILN